MKIFLLRRTDEWGYEDYDAIVVCANDANDAITIDPDGKPFKYKNPFGAWARTTGDIECTEIGVANKDQKRGVILASFNAG
jgi:hypothetical protein